MVTKAFEKRRKKIKKAVFASLFAITFACRLSLPRMPCKLPSHSFTVPFRLTLLLYSHLSLALLVTLLQGIYST